MAMENEFGEKIPEKTVKNIRLRIASLSVKQIDELFYKCGLIYTKHEKPFKALLADQPGEIKKFKGDSIPVLELLEETPFKEVKENLEKIEKST